MKRVLLADVAAPFLATGSAHAADDKGNTGPFWLSLAKISCGQLNGILWKGMNGAGSFVRWYPSREETTDIVEKDKVLFYQGEKCKTEPYNCPILGVSVPGEMCGIALPCRSRTAPPC